MPSSIRLRRDPRSGILPWILWVLVALLGLGALIFTMIVAFVQWLYLLGKPFYQKPEPWIVPVFIASLCAVATGVIGVVVLQIRYSHREAR